jgi:hypothetical protein
MPLLVLWRVAWRPEETFIVRQRLGKQVSAATDTQAPMQDLLGTTFSIRSVQSSYKKEFSWESVVVELQSCKWAVSQELSSARKTEKMALWVQLAVGLWIEDFTCTIVQWYMEYVIQWNCYSSCVKIRCQETDSGDCNIVRTLVCVSVNCKLWK